MGGAEPRGPGPERDTAGDGEEGREERQRREHRADDADCGDRAESGVRPEIGQKQAEETRDDSAAGGGDRLEHTPYCPPRGRARRLGVARLLPVPGDEEEGVVRGRADDEDEEDPLHLAVERDDVGSGEGDVEEDGGAERGHRREEDEDRRQGER